MKFTACFTKETTCVTALHSIPKNELIQNFKNLTCMFFSRRKSRE